MNMKRFIKTGITTLFLVLFMSFTAFAGEWQQDTAGWWYSEDDGSYPVNQWKEIDGKQYYFNENGYMLLDTTTPDGYKVGPDGAWVQDGVTQNNEVADKQVDMELMVYRETEQNLNHLVEWENKTGMYLVSDFVSVKGWQYTFGQKKYDIGKERPTPMRLLRMTSDCKAVEILAEFPLPEQYDDVASGYDFFIAQGKVCFSINYEKWNYKIDSDIIYYQYDITNGQLNVSSKESNDSMKVEGEYNPSDYLYYTYKDGVLSSCNYKREKVANTKVATIDLPEFHRSDVIGHSIKLSKMEGDIAYFTATINLNKLRNGHLNESYNVRVDKNTGAILGYEKK